VASKTGVICMAPMLKPDLEKLVELNVSEEKTCRADHILNTCSHMAL
jgi:hypothetical protein